MQRTIRTFAYGFLSVILAIYLKLIGLGDLYIGLILTATLINSVIFTLIASFYADRIGRRKILIVYTALMSLSGAIFFVTTNYMRLGHNFQGVLLLLISILSVLLSGFPALLEHQYGLDHVGSIKLLFSFYSILGLGVLGIYFLLSNKIEIMREKKEEIETNVNNNKNKIPKTLKQTLSPKSKETVAKVPRPEEIPELV